MRAYKLVKVVGDKMVSAIMHIEPSMVTEYVIGERAVPKLRSTKLFVFQSLEDLENFRISEGAIVGYKVLVGEAEDAVKTDSIPGVGWWLDWKSRLLEWWNNPEAVADPNHIHSFSAPKGTMFCSAFTPKEVV